MKTRILILGGPKAGKTTTSKSLGVKMGIKVQHLDELNEDHEWSEQSDAIAEGLDEEGPWIKEGVAGVRGLRKWLKNNPGKLPPFQIKVMKKPLQELKTGQKIMHKQHETILRECLKEIEKRKAEK